MVLSPEDLFGAGRDLLVRARARPAPAAMLATDVADVTTEIGAVRIDVDDARWRCTDLLLALQILDGRPARLHHADFAAAVAGGVLGHRRRRGDEHGAPGAGEPARPFTTLDARTGSLGIGSLTVTHIHRAGSGYGPWSWLSWACWPCDGPAAGRLHRVAVPLLLVASASASPSCPVCRCGRSSRKRISLASSRRCSSPRRWRCPWSSGARSAPSAAFRRRRALSARAIQPLLTVLAPDRASRRCRPRRDPQPHRYGDRHGDRVPHRGHLAVVTVLEGEGLLTDVRPWCSCAPRSPPPRPRC